MWRIFRSLHNKGELGKCLYSKKNNIICTHNIDTSYIHNEREKYKNDSSTIISLSIFTIFEFFSLIISFTCVHIISTNNISIKKLLSLLYHLHQTGCCHPKASLDCKTTYNLSKTYNKLRIGGSRSRKKMKDFDW